MPTSYVKKLSEKHGKSTGEGEEKWDDAKDAAGKQGQADNYAYRTAIFKKMMGEKSNLRIGMATARQRIVSRLKVEIAGPDDSTLSPDRVNKLKMLGFQPNGGDQFLMDLMDGELSCFLDADGKVMVEGDISDLRASGDMSFNYPSNDGAQVENLIRADAITLRKTATALEKMADALRKARFYL